MAGYRFVIRQDLKPEIEPNLGWNVVFSKGVWIFTGILTFSMTPSHSNLPEPDKLADPKVGPLVVPELMDLSLPLDDSVVGEENSSQGSLTSDSGAEILARAKEREDILKLFDKITDSR